MININSVGQFTKSSWFALVIAASSQRPRSYSLFVNKSVLNIGGSGVALLCSIENTFVS